MRSTGQEEASRANEQHDSSVISKSSALNILFARGRTVDGFSVQSCDLQLGGTLVVLASLFSDQRVVQLFPFSVYVCELK